jgi:hypothetical protein
VEGVGGGDGLRHCDCGDWEYFLKRRENGLNIER